MLSSQDPSKDDTDWDKDYFSLCKTNDTKPCTLSTFILSQVI